MNIRGLLISGPWQAPEVKELAKILEPLPLKWVERNPLVRIIERRDVLRDGPEDAPGHSMYDPSSRTIVVFDKGVYNGGKAMDKQQLRRSIYHELAHSVINQDRGLLQSWSQATAGDGFVDHYAKKGPDEDFCDTVSEYLIDPGATTQAVPQKAAFLARLLSQEKTAMPHPVPSLHAFADELQKVAVDLSLGQRLLAKLPLYSRMAAAGTVAGIGGHWLGKQTGKAQGLEEGSAGAEEAYQAGIERGAKAMQDAIQQKMQGGGQ